MAIQLNDGIQTNAPRAVDMRSGKLVSGKTVPYANLMEALTAIDIAYRHEGLEFLVKDEGVIKKYRFTADYETDGVEEIVGTPGDQGDQGEQGLSAYQVAVENGFVGDESAWLASLQGEPGAGATINSGIGITAVDEGEGNFTINAGGEVPNTEGISFDLLSGFGFPAGKVEIDNGGIESSNIVRFIASVNGADDSNAELVVSANRATGDQTQVNISVTEADGGPSQNAYINVKGREIGLAIGEGAPGMIIGESGISLFANDESGNNGGINVFGNSAGLTSSSSEGSSFVTCNEDKVIIQSEGGVDFIDASGDSSGRVDFQTLLVLLSNIAANADFIDDAAASAGGIPYGGIYHNAGALRINIA